MNSPQTTFLFWNIHKNPVTQSLVRLVEGHNVQVLLLAESAYRDNPSLLVSALNAGPRPRGSKPFIEIGASYDAKVHVFSRLRQQRWKAQITHPHYVIWSVYTDSGKRLLLTAAHFPSVQEDQGDERRKVATDLCHDRGRLEARSALLRMDEHGQKQPPFSLVIGDLNANPFDAGIAGVYGLNANLSRDIVRRGDGQRQLHGRSYPFFYNPMWHFFGTPDADEARERRVQGTYYKTDVTQARQNPT